MENSSDKRSTKIKILLLEDDPLIAQSLELSFSYKQVHVVAADTIKKAQQLIKTQNFDAYILDVNLPDGLSFNLCQELRKNHPKTPIIMLTAQVDEESAVQGMTVGADDYVRKPFGTNELFLRLQKLLSRHVVNSLVFGALKVDLSKRQVWCNDAEISLGKKEFEILSLLVKKQGEVLTRNDILDIFGADHETYDRTIDSHLSHLRRKLKEAGAKEVQIIPVYGVGYRLELKRG